MTNPAPYYVEKKTIAVIDGLRIETYSPNFVRVLDTTVFGDEPSDCYNSIVRGAADFAGHPAVDAYIAEMEIAREEYRKQVEYLHKNASFGAPKAA